MAAPITWQTINGPSMGTATVPMESAAKLILGGFDRAGEALTGYNKQQQAIEDRNANTQVQTFLERLQREQTVEGISRLQASGELESMRARLRPEDLAKVRGAEDARLESLRTQITKGQTFQQEQDRIAQLPIAQQAEVLAAKGDLAGLDTLLKSNPNLLNPAKYLSAAKTVVDTDTKNRQEGEKAATQMARDLAQVTLAQAQAADIPVDNARLDAETAVKRSDAATARATATATELNKLQNSTISSPEAMTAVIGNITKAVKEPKQVTALVQQLNTALSSDPLFASLPAAEVERVAMQFAGKAGDTTWGMGGDWTEEMKTALNRAYTSNAEGIKSAESRKAQLANLLEEHRGAASAAQRTAYPEWAAAEDEAKARNVGRLAAAAAATNTSPAQSTAQKSSDVQKSSAGSEKRQKDAFLEERLQLEQQEMAAGPDVRKEFSDEVKKYLQDRPSLDRGVIEKVGSALASGALSAGNAFNDLFTLPVRGVMGATNTLLRVPNAYGAGIPYFPDDGMLSSLTPYSDKQRLANEGATIKQDLAARRAAFEKRVAQAQEAEAKKAK